MVPLESSASVVTIDGEKIVVRELGAAAPPVSRLSGKPPLPSIRKKDASRQRPSSDDSSSGEGKFSICSPFSRWTPEARDKKGHTKVKPPGSELTHRASTGNSPRPIKTRTFRRADDTDVMLDMVAKAQSRRMDDQRGSLSLKDLELPDFLRVKPGSHQGKEYRPSSCGNSLSSSRLDSDISWSITPIKQYPSEGVQRGLTPLRGGGDRSFSGDGVLPSHERAERYFGARTSVARSPDFDDSRLCERSLADIGMRGGATVDEAAEDSPSVSGGACDATVLRAPSGDLDATLTSGSTPRTADRSSEGRALGDGGIVGRVNVGSAFEGGRARSYENVRAGATGAALVGKRVLGAAAGDAAAVGAPLRISTSADGHTESLV
ncbi:PREDICTED: uncharacterized protein LOC106813628 [Priapulus caudatus]|uniref:Uncharacterized protein LOC106813628 n=1 Tax=Priapulus caudatus TaxID=37621 RepID=A0ABM1EM77_PRICU|nr:PREDICTED: uncharacterized protein LOC106813628 [Priapulus caudatus]